VVNPGYVPPGWPERVRAPGTPHWETSAVAYLLDQCPADFRGYRVLRNHPLVLVQFAEHFVEGQCGAVANGLAAVRTGLRGQVRPDVVEAAAEVWLEQGAALMRTRRSVGLVGEALRGRSFVPKL
jgi:hypothetical protein